MSSLKTIQQRIRKNKKWGFLAEMIGETREGSPMMGVNARGILLVNPNEAAQISSEMLVERVRREFVIAQELRERVNGFR